MVRQELAVVSKANVPRKEATMTGLTHEGSEMDPRWDELVETADEWAEHSENCGEGCFAEYENDDTKAMLEAGLACSTGHEILRRLFVLEFVLEARSA